MLKTNQIICLPNTHFRWTMFFVEILYRKFKMPENFTFWILNNLQNVKNQDASKTYNK